MWVGGKGKSALWKKWWLFTHQNKSNVICNSTGSRVGINMLKNSKSLLTPSPCFPFTNLKLYEDVWLQILCTFFTAACSWLYSATGSCCAGGNLPAVRWLQAGVCASPADISRKGLSDLCCTDSSNVHHDQSVTVNTVWQLVPLGCFWDRPFETEICSFEWLQG